MNTKPTIKYDPEAYRPDTVEPMPKESSWIYRSRRLYPKPIPTLPWGHYYNREAADTIEVTKPEGPLYNFLKMFNLQQKRVLIPPPEKWWLNQMFPLYRIWRVNHRQMHFKGINIIPLFLFGFSSVCICALIFNFLL